MNKKFPDGVYPVMLTPFTEENKVDYESLGRLVEWYIASGAAGLFADCQSSELFFLSLEERVEIARFVKEKAHGRRMGQASNRKADSIGRYIHHRSGAELQPFADRNQKFVEQGGSIAVIKSIADSGILKIAQLEVTDCAFRSGRIQDELFPFQLSNRNHCSVCQMVTARHDNKRRRSGHVIPGQTLWREMIHDRCKVDIHRS